MSSGPHLLSITDRSIVRPDPCSERISRSMRPLPAIGTGILPVDSPMDHSYLQPDAISNSQPQNGDRDTMTKIMMPTCAATVSRSKPWANNSSAAFRWLWGILGAIYAVLRSLQLLQHFMEPQVDRCRAISNATFGFVSFELLPKRAVNSQCHRDSVTMTCPLRATNLPTWHVLPGFTRSQAEIRD